MRVVFGLDNFGIGGTELNAVRTAEHLTQRGVALSVVCLRPEGPLRARYDALGVEVHAFPLRGLWHPSTLRQGLRLRDFLRRLQPDVFHAHDFYSNVFSVPWARLAGVPLVVASRRWWLSPSRVRATLNRWSYRAAHLVLANSESVARLVHEEGVPSFRIRVVPNFIEEEGFASPLPESRRTLRAEFLIPSGAVLFGAVGRLSPGKGHTTLVEAFATLGGRPHLVLVGDGPERPALEAQVTRLGVTDRVHFAGVRPNRPILAGAFDIAVLPSYSEGFPNAVVEAMATARPVIASAVGGTPDAIEDEVSGLLVPPRNAVALGRAMAGLAESAERRTALGTAALARARSKYHEEQVIPRLIAMYREAGGDRP